jgi:hypothetical protein
MRMHGSVVSTLRGTFFSRLCKGVTPRHILWALSYSFSSSKVDDGSTRCHLGKRKRVARKGLILTLVRAIEFILLFLTSNWRFVVEVQ